mmetsp:Transcript_2290/g.6798  ORF Transcript_2290/g.6798 Transcript_2290/m.6798 type:complete len:677 (+) Transcript_2290:1025-3055(+)
MTRGTAGIPDSVVGTGTGDAAAEGGVGGGGGGSGSVCSGGESSGAGTGTAAALREQGNALYKAGQYAEALRLYSQAVGAEPRNGALHGNRAACWMMLGKYERAVADCSEGLRHEAGSELGKLRGRQATALTRLGKLDRAADVLQQGALRGGEHAEALGAQLRSVKGLQASLAVGRQALEEGAFGKAKRCALEVAGGGVSEDPEVWLLLARAHLSLGEHVEAAREAQKAIALDADTLDAYTLRADALVGMGLAEKAAAVDALVVRGAEGAAQWREPMLTDGQLRLLPGLDVQYAALQAGKAAILERVDRVLPASDPKRAAYRDALRRCVKVEDLQDVEEQVRLQLDALHGRSARGDAARLPNGNRRPGPRGLLGAALAARADVLAEWFGLPVEELVENVAVHARQQHGPLDEAQPPLELAAAFVASDGASTLSGELRKPDGALRAAREAYAQQLAVEPQFRRRARAHLQGCARLVVRPTPRGEREVDPAHRFYKLVELAEGRMDPVSGRRVPIEGGGRKLRSLRVQGGEAAALAGGFGGGGAAARAEQLLLCRKAAEEGFFTMELAPPEEAEDALLQLCCSCFLSTEGTETGDAWNEQRTEVLRRALRGLVYPKLLAELLEAAMREAQAELASYCAAQLRRLLLAPPLRPPADADEAGRKKKKKKKKKDTSADKSEL